MIVPKLPDPTVEVVVVDTEDGTLSSARDEVDRQVVVTHPAVDGSSGDAADVDNVFDAEHLPFGSSIRLSAKSNHGRYYTPPVFHFYNYNRYFPLRWQAEEGSTKAPAMTSTGAFIPK
jgi:hypothetical protein